MGYALLNCPFCGGSAHLMDMGYPHKVYCEKCGATTPGRGFGDEGEADAVARWNRRHVPAIPEPFTPTPIDPVAQHYPCSDCLGNPATCGGCERLKRYEAAREAE